MSVLYCHHCSCILSTALENIGFWLKEIRKNGKMIQVNDVYCIECAEDLKKTLNEFVGKKDS